MISTCSCGVTGPTPATTTTSTTTEVPPGTENARNYEVYYQSLRKGEVVRSCKELKCRTGSSYAAGVYNLTVIHGGPPVPAFCDEDGWTVIQSRGQHGNPINYFYRNWADYIEGCGEPGGGVRTEYAIQHIFIRCPGKEHWFGLRHIHAMTNSRYQYLRVRLVDLKDREGFGYYSGFKLKNDVTDWEYNAPLSYYLRGYVTMYRTTLRCSWESSWTITSRKRRREKKRRKN